MSKKPQNKGGKKDQAVNISSANPEHRLERKRSIIVLLITCIGVIVIFTSWISQNYFKSRWFNDKLYLEKTQQLIELETLNAQHWEFIFNIEAKETNPNKVRHILSAYNYVKSVTKILAWEEARVSEDGSKEAPIFVKNMIHAKAKEALLKNDIKGLTKLVIIARETQNKFIKDLDNRFFTKLYEANSKSSLWDKIFLMAYVVGSLLIAVRWWLVNVLSWPCTYVYKT